MSKINCEVIEDMLPIYVENMASPSTKELVEEHLASCESCRKKEAEMHQEVVLPKDIDTKPLRSINKILFQKKVTLVVLTILSMLFLAVLCIITVQ